MKIADHGIVSYAGLIQGCAALRRRRSSFAIGRARAVSGSDSAVSRGDDSRYGVRRQVVEGSPLSLRPAASAPTPPSTTSRCMGNIPRCTRAITTTATSITKATTRDRACLRWTGRGRNCFPSTAPFLGEKLVVHLIGRGCQAVAVPESVKYRSGFLDRMEEQLEITRADAVVRPLRRRPR